MAASSERVVLVGARGAGKSTVGPLLAARLGVSFVDTDREIGAILRVDASFRDPQAAVLGRVLGGPPAVVAAGGGAVLWPGFAAAARGWRVVRLDAAPEVLSRRLREDPRDRPSLTGRPPHEEIAEV